MGNIPSLRDRLLAEILQLPAEEKLDLVEAIWASSRSEFKPAEFTDAQKAELDRRFERMKLDPEEGSTWAEVEARIRRKR